ncbi:endoglucanase-4 [Colletotrichum cuscutae]|uniref:Endoglucanase-4 n=1 Tax=Colletotrichum cuscutae TaxID=1209917 RepID=A0AAI9YAB8_9PEZI|nr:endoglucanase-4 [Colletotrichum cuscutae]
MRNIWTGRLSLSFHGALYSILSPIPGASSHVSSHGQGQPRPRIVLLEVWLPDTTTLIQTSTTAATTTITLTRTSSTSSSSSSSILSSSPSSSSKISTSNNSPTSATRTASQTPSPTTFQTMTTTAPSAGEPTQNLYGQCGGMNYAGLTRCPDYATCTTINPYYAQCSPAPVPAGAQSLYGQCGGINWPAESPTSCVPGATCKTANPYYAQCTPA